MSSEIRGRVFYRYMSWREVRVIEEEERTTGSGKLRGGAPGETFWTTDFYEESRTVKSSLALGYLPEVRLAFRITNEPELELEGTPVRAARGEPGGGTEWMSEEIVEVEVISVDNLE